MKKKKKKKKKKKRQHTIENKTIIRKRDRRYEHLEKSNDRAIKAKFKNLNILSRGSFDNRIGTTSRTLSLLKHL
jgi:hypothetical protein